MSILALQSINALQLTSGKVRMDGRSQLNAAFDVR
jgi:hypothetical protein